MSKAPKTSTPCSLSIRVKTPLGYTIVFFLLMLSTALSAKDSKQNYDHEELIEKLRDSEQIAFENEVKLFESRIRIEPNNSDLLFEYCLYLDQAMYDAMEEENPNQELSDACFEKMKKRFPHKPEYINYVSAYSWGEEKDEHIKFALKSFEENESLWTDEQIGELYYDVANYYYMDDNYRQAHKYIKFAATYRNDLQFALLYANLLIEDEDSAAAIEVLRSYEDSLPEIWHLNRKANLLLELESFDEALETLMQVNERDSTYVSNGSLAKSFEGVGEFEKARKYLLMDTSNSWSYSDKKLNLFLFDMKNSPDSLAIASYHALRDEGLKEDPFGAYRLRLFMKAPFRGIKFRDFLSPILLSLLILCLIFFPLGFILPIHTYGHRYRSTILEQHPRMVWGLKSFWFIAAGYLLATLFASWIYPEDLHSYFVDNGFEGFTVEEMARTSLYFFLGLLLTTVLVSLKRPLHIFGPGTRSLAECFYVTIGIFFAFTIVKGIYLRLGINLFGLEVSDFSFANPLLYAAREDITSMITSYGMWPVFIIVAIVVPIYEEIMFRGVILSSSIPYVGFMAANVIQSTLFAAAHGSLILFPLYFILGFVLGRLFKTSNGLLTGIFVHMLNNAVAFYAIVRVMDM